MAVCVFPKTKKPLLAQRLFCFYTATRGWQESAVLLFVQTIQQVPDAEHVLHAEGAVVLAVAGAAFAGAFLPQLAAMVGANAAVKAAVVVGAQDLDDAGLAAAVAVGSLGEVTVLEVMDVAHMGERDAVAVLAHDGGHIVVGVGVHAAGAERQAVVRVIDHRQEAVDALGVNQQTGQAEDVPRGIVLMDGHLDVALAAGGHDRLKEVLEVIPQLLLGDGGVGLEQLVKLGHALRLPAGEGHVVLLGKFENVVCHALVVVLDQVLLIEQGGGAVADRVEQVGAGPVKDGHEVVADGLDTELGQVADALLVVLDILVAGGQADLDVIVDIDGLNDGGAEASRVDLVYDLLDLGLLPDLAGHFTVQGPDDLLNTGNLLNVAQGDGVIALTIPAPTHFHRHVVLLLFV